MSKHNSTTIHTSLIQLHGMIIKSIDATIITFKSNEVMTTNIIINMIIMLQRYRKGDKES